jgi:glycerate dehydrogenase
MAEFNLNIVVLDAKPLDDGDVDWSPLRKLGVLTLYDNTSPEELAARIADAEIIFSNKVKLPRAAFEAAPHLKMIGVLATGYDVVDSEAAREKNIPVCNVPSYSAAFTAQSAIALMLELAHRTGAHNSAVHDGLWSSQPYFSFWNYPLVELSGKTLLIIGLGNIGKRVAKIAVALGMGVLAAQLPGRAANSESAEIEYVPLDEGLLRADVISLHCPATPQTRGLVDAEFISKMKMEAFLINVSRGALVNEMELATALQAQKIAGYATDVLSSEPPQEDNPLLSAPNCIITPHIAWAAPECRQRIIEASAENLRALLSGTPQNVVNCR